MMAGNPNWWNMNIPSQPCSSSASSPFLSQSTIPPLFQYPHSVVFADYNNTELPQSWSQLLLSGFSGEEEKYSLDATRNLVGNWEEETILNDNNNHLCQYGSVAEEVFGDQAYNYINKLHNMNAWSPTSCITTSTKNSNILDFSNTIDKKVDSGSRKKHQKPDHSSNECNSTGTGGTCKKARVESSSSTQSPLKVRKEKLGDRITALHQIVSPFGKTDTASVLLEAIGYIRFLQGQIEVLTSSYIDSASGNLNNTEAEGVHDDMSPMDLRSRGLCLVPVSCTLQVEGNDSTADYWAPAPFSGGF